MRPIVESSEPHRVQLLDTAALAISRILASIASAKEQISLQYTYMTPCDWVTRQIFSAIEARSEALARQGKKLRVRLLVDYANYYDPTVSLAIPSEEELQDFVDAYRIHGIEFKIYNPLRALSLEDLERMNNLRDHQKRLIVDGKVIIAGGRLLSDDYFGAAAVYNRFETDLWIEGPIVNAAQRYFDRLWGASLSVNRFDRNLFLSRTTEKDVSELRGCLEPMKMSEEDREKLREATVADTERRPVVTIPRIVMAFDIPGNNAKEAGFTPYFHSLLAGARKYVLSQQQYFAPSDELGTVFRELAGKGVSVEVVTNSYISGDEDLIDHLTLRNALLYNQVPGIRVLLFRGQVDRKHSGLWKKTQQELISVWQIHSKSVVIDGRSIWVGSNNFDNRAEKFNLETGVFIPDQPVLARELEETIRENERYAVLAQKGADLDVIVFGFNRKISIWRRVSSELKWLASFFIGKFF